MKMGYKISFAIFGIICLSGLAYGEVIDASNIEQVNGQVVFNNVSCYTCEGPNCSVADVTTLPVQQCDLFGAQCATTFNVNGTVSARGCSNLLSMTANATCISAPGQLCFYCVSPLCNTALTLTEFVECYQCDSYSNSECVWNTNDSSISVVQCNQGCIVALLPKSSSDNETYETYRGCGSEVSALGMTSCDGNNGSCWSCNGTKCNDFNEPSDRLVCNFCANADCNATFSQDCLSYRADDKCAYVLTVNGTISYLACASNFPPSTLDYMKGLGILVECDGVNCNTLTNAPHLQLNTSTCVSCSSDQNEFCATDPSKITTTVECTDLNKLCVTRITSEGHTVRGCLADQSQSDFLDCYTGSNSTYCSTCNATSCNNEIFPADRLSCYVCNSNNDQACESSPTNATVCPIYSPEETCTQYLLNSTTIRGCSSQFPCAGEKCSPCDTSACNDKDLNNGSATIQTTGAVLFAALLVFVFQKLEL